MKAASEDSKNRWLLAGILFLALALRITGIQFGLPYLYHADEPIVVNHALAYGTGDLNPHFFKIPPLVSYLLFVVYGAAFLTARGVGIFKGVSDFENLFLQDPTFFYLLARIIFGAVLGMISIYILYQIIRRHFSKRHALLSSFFLAVAFLHVRDSHFIYTDIPLVLVLISSFSIFFLIAEGKCGWKIHAAAGAWIGLAAGIKYNGVLIALSYLTASFLSENRKRLVNAWIVACFAAFFVYSLANPFTWLDFRTFQREIAMQAHASGKTGFLHHLLYSLNGGIGFPLLAAGILGIISGLLQREKKRIVIASFITGYYFLLVFRSQPYDRYVLPLIPFLLFFSADFLLLISKSFPVKAKSGLLIFSSLALAAPSLAKCVLSDFIFLRKDVRTEAKEWVESSVEPGTSIALDWSFFQPRLNFSRESLQEKLGMIQSLPDFSNAQRRRIESLISQTPNQKGYSLYFLSDNAGEHHFLFEQPALPYDLAYLKKKKVAYVFIARVQKDYQPAGFYEQLKKDAILVKRFSPYHNNREFPIDRRPLTGGPFLWRELIEREKNGQPVEIYKLK